MEFSHRLEAAHQLAEKLNHLRGQNPLVLAIPRGAVPMGQVIADTLDGDLDVELVHKFGFPHNPEFALGAVTEDGAVFLGTGAEQHQLNPDDLKDFAYLEIKNLQKKRKLYTPYRRAIDPRGRLAIIVDDGIATGATMEAAVRSLRGKGAQRLVVATPVASREAVERLLFEGAEVVALHIPSDFFSVGQFYVDFSQVTDDEVIAILRQSQATSASRHLEPHP